MCARCAGLAAHAPPSCMHTACCLGNPGVIICVVFRPGYSHVLNAQQALVAIQDIICATDGVKVLCATFPYVVVATCCLETGKRNSENIKHAFTLAQMLCVPSSVHVLYVLITHPSLLSTLL